MKSKDQEEKTGGTDIGDVLLFIPLMLIGAALLIFVSRGFMIFSEYAMEAYSAHAVSYWYGYNIIAIALLSISGRMSSFTAKDTIFANIPVSAIFVFYFLAVLTLLFDTAIKADLFATLNDFMGAKFATIPGDALFAQAIGAEAASSFQNLDLIFAGVVGLLWVASPFMVLGVAILFRRVWQE